MSGRYDHLSREALIGLLERRDVLQRYGLIWEREGIEPDRALNLGYVVFDLGQELSTPAQDASGWPNVVIEGDNWDALRATAATNALGHEAHIAKAQEWLGHGNIAAMRIYDHRRTRPEDGPTFKVAY